MRCCGKRQTRRGKEEWLGYDKRVRNARRKIRRVDIEARMSWDSLAVLVEDCFSSVDTETEERILSGLARMRRGKTTMLISHRVSTARHADRIFIIDNGHISESGTHEELLALGGYYSDLAAVQSDQDQDRARKARLLHELDEELDATSIESAMRAGGDG